MLIPAPVLRAATTSRNAPPAQTLDIVLQKNNTLLGQIVDTQGVPQKRLDVAVVQDGRVIHRAKTNESGFFFASNLQSGLYQVVSDKTVGTYRLWDSRVAPPSAQQGALLVRGQGPIRAQQGPIAYWLTNPWVIAGLITTAVVVPIVIHNSRTGDDGTPASN
jgi:hypothetical protein